MTAPNTKLKTTRKTAAPAAQSKGGKSRSIELAGKPGDTVDRILAATLVRGVLPNAVTAVKFLQAGYEELSLMDIARELHKQGEAVNRGDLAMSEELLVAQSVSLNAIFGEMARRAALNMGEHLVATETYMRLALKAQSQCRSTLETLVTMKNPPVVFARQANFANGPQQVNNGGASEDTTRTQEKQMQPNKLLEESTHGSTQLDTRTTPATSGEDSMLEPLGKIDWPQNRKR